VSSSPRLSCFACGELNTPDSRFCKNCGRQLVRERQTPTVVHDPRNRLMLILVLVLILSCALFGIFGLLSSKILRGSPPPTSAIGQIVAIS